MESSFNKLLREYPSALDSRKMFGNLVKDYFPKNLLQANLIMALYDMKIHEVIRTVRNIGNTFAFRYVKRLMDEHGMSRKNADQAVALWCICYGKNTLKKPCEISLVDYAATSRPAIQENKPKTGSYQQNRKPKDTEQRADNTEHPGRHTQGQATQPDKDGKDCNYGSK